ncbi:DNA-binding LacI/PurR family transcriptional regulator [Spinactinospora alkalitolerans]|uniref:DNA-binding LacI/PurR family transcriptional regulator n=1 Tax=Spinactinospora alkalitolerans TaxID=687207 RepID=A0A852TXF8_9ACTN|nr:LacI family DNA-binding transcriptional regulator [Spinactinospora alkalitolerans]NYE47977.1 DNA-binding LacI/PurR family transcriptional regulator [Spinactinospora alkalitolerans]
MTSIPPEQGEVRRPTIRDVAKHAGVSKSLVSLVLQGSDQVSPARRGAVLQAMEQIGYRPNAAARSLSARRTGTIGVLLSHLRNPWIVDLLDGLHPILHEHGLRMLFGDGRLNQRTDESLIQTFLEMRVDGLVLVGTIPISPAIAQIAGEVPTVIASSRDIDLPSVDTIAADDWRGAESATRHLIELGHTRIAHISGRGVVGAIRRQAYEETMRACGLEDDIAVEAGDGGEEGAYRAAVKLLSGGKRPTAIFASNDMSCIGALSAADDVGVRTPEELSLVGYDNTYLARLRHLWLTSVDPANEEVGRRAGRALLARIDDPLRQAHVDLVEPSLQVRGSTVPIPGASSPTT